MTSTTIKLSDTNIDGGTKDWLWDNCTRGEVISLADLIQILRTDATENLDPEIADAVNADDERQIRAIASEGFSAVEID